MSMTHFSNEQWDGMVRAAIKNWRRQDRVQDSALAGLHVVGERAAAEGVSPAVALKLVLGEAIMNLAPDAQSQPSFSAPNDPRWSAEKWRYYNILHALTARGEPCTRGEIMALIGVSDSHYYREYKAARMMLADELRNLEGMPMGPDDAPWQLAYPSGGMRPDDPFYVERDVDTKLSKALAGADLAITIRGSRQVGKTSLLARGIGLIQERYDAQLIYVDFQGVDDEARSSLRDLCRFLSYRLFRTLDLDTRVWETSWEDDYLTLETMRELMIYALERAERPILLAMDEVDILQLMPYSMDFFGLLRSWINWRSSNVLWRKVMLMMAISTEPYLLVNKGVESPFNTGYVLYLNDFTPAQTADLNRRYGSPLSAAEAGELHQLLNGHPYLTRVALYTLAVGDMTWRELKEEAAADDGPFYQHLRWQFHRLEDDPRLLQAVAEVVRNRAVSDQKVGYHLMKAGLVFKVGDNYVCRCELYRRYFADKLDVRIAS